MARRHERPSYFPPLTNHEVWASFPVQEDRRYLIQTRPGNPMFNDPPVVVTDIFRYEQGRAVPLEIGPEYQYVHQLWSEGKASPIVVHRPAEPT